MLINPLTTTYLIVRQVGDESSPRQSSRRQLLMRQQDLKTRRGTRVPGDPNASSRTPSPVSETSFLDYAALARRPLKRTSAQRTFGIATATSERLKCTVHLAPSHKERVEGTSRWGRRRELRIRHFSEETV